MKPKYKYFLVTTCNQPIMFNSLGQGCWVTKTGEKSLSSYSLEFILSQTINWKILELNRREFFKFAKSDYNKTHNS